MKLLAIHRFWSLPVLVAALCVLFGGRAEAQVDPTWDHYKVYRANPLASAVIPVFLRDQFGESQHETRFLELFANPVEKRVPNPPPGQVYPITDSLTHYTWWSITPSPFGATVRVDNQFGNQELHVHEARWLLNPALKNDPTPGLPRKNHYKCYACDGQPVNRPVALADQFDTWQTTVLYPRWFCNPTFKQVPGAAYEIVDSRQHYVVYDFNPADPGHFFALVRDQFGQVNLELSPGIFLMVPTDKLLVTETKATTWGRLKQLYR